MFLIALLKFLYEPYERKRVLWLSFAAALSFYVYSYLSYIALLTLTFIFFWFLFTKRFKELRSLVTCGIFTALLLIPFGFYTLMQMQDPYYFETLGRIGLVYTHIPSIEVFFYGRWLVVGMLLAWLVPLKQKVFWFSTGVALFVSLFLNIITGVELTLGVHVGRFVVLWMAMILGVGLYEWYSARNLAVSRTKYIIVAVLFVLLSVGVVRNLPHGLDFFKFKFNDHGNSDIADIQAYASPLRWLDKNVSEQSVIWANESVSKYIPIITRHYPLFAEGIVLHSISGQELEERYLLSQSMNVLTLEDLKRNLGLYAGAGPSELQSLAQNRRAWFCEVLARFVSYRECPPRTDAIALRGEEYFKMLAERFVTIKENQGTLLEQFHVKYLIIDRTNDNVEFISQGDALYDDGRFVILPLPLR